jgi:phosphatidylserine synthase
LGLCAHFALDNLTVVQRLFSMFPTGVAGFALLLLRGLVVSTLLVDGTSGLTLAGSSPVFLPFIVVAACLGIGFMTPYCTALGCLAEIRALAVSAGGNQFHLSIAILMSVVLGILGPGAYSLDSRLFGRRLLSLPSRKK